MTALCLFWAGLLTSPSARAQGLCRFVFLKSDRIAVLESLRGFGSARHLDLQRRIIQHIALDLQFNLESNPQERADRWAELVLMHSNPMYTPAQRAEFRRMYWLKLELYIQGIWETVGRYDRKPRPPHHEWGARWTEDIENLSLNVNRDLRTYYNRNMLPEKTRAIVETVRDAHLHPEIADDTLLRLIEASSAKNANRVRDSLVNARNARIREAGEPAPSFHILRASWNERRVRKNFEKLVEQMQKAEKAIPQRAAEKAFEEGWDVWRERLLADALTGDRLDPVALSKRLDQLASVIFLFNRLELPNGVRTQDVLSGRAQLSLDMQHDLALSLERRRQQLDFLRTELHWLEVDTQAAVREIDQALADGSASTDIQDLAARRTALGGFDSALRMLNSFSKSTQNYFDAYGLAAEQGEATIRKFAAAVREKSWSQRVWERIRGTGRR